MTSKEVEQAIRALGLAVTRVDGKWRINYRGGKEATAYYTTDDDDALGMARAMEVARGQQRSRADQRRSAPHGVPLAYNAGATAVIFSRCPQREQGRSKLGRCDGATFL